jgi:NitT/TauT family transport system ATP-binding protein
MKEEALLELTGIGKSFNSNSHKKQKILENINLQLHVGEIIAIIGKSGCGKSTLLRIIADLENTSKGKIRFPIMKHGRPSMSMVFQTFALFPWLNVIQNVELGLETDGKLSEEKKRKALECVELIGLAGFELAMPRELSGGMKQRVGFARGLAMNPDILLLDEPFSALDVLTANTLKNDFVKLWSEKKIAVKSVMMITHSIEEAVMMSDRILVLGNVPATVTQEFNVNLARPRDVKSKEFQQIVDKIYDSMTLVNNSVVPTETRVKTKESDIGQKLPLVLPHEIFALLELLNTKEHNGKIEVEDLMYVLHIKMQHVMRIVEALTIFNFATFNGGVVKITKSGKSLIESDLDNRKTLFAKYLLANVGLSNYICKVVSERPTKKVHKKRFKIHLEDYMSPEQANTTLNAIIAWGRYGEIFSYDDNRQIFSLN